MNKRIGHLRNDKGLDVTTKGIVIRKFWEKTLKRIERYKNLNCSNNLANSILS